MYPLGTINAFTGLVLPILIIFSDTKLLLEEAWSSLPKMINFTEGRSLRRLLMFIDPFHPIGYRILISILSVLLNRTIPDFFFRN